jgi:penicillin-binding protein 1C
MLQKPVSIYKSNKASIKKWAKRITVAGLLCFSIWYINCLPHRLFNDPTSTVLLDSRGKLLGAKIADDGQWRFESKSPVPEKFKACILEFEDRNYYRHYGISIKGIGRALTQNIKNKKVVSGGSTITMQLARIMRKNPSRNVPEKILEMILATRLEIRYSKTEILRYYTSHAPFGNNVVGLDAAAWRFFGREPDKLSWAESATLAVLPNAPGLIYPGKNHQRLLEKRNRLLKRLFETGKIDETTFQLSLNEPLPERPLPLPREAPHLLARFIKEGSKGQTIYSSIDRNLQAKTKELLQNHSRLLQENRIFNGAVMITSVKTGKVLAYVGNTSCDDKEQSSDVDCIVAPRSTGSILKPFLFGKSLEDGIITPNTLIPDVPTQFGNFSPKNFTLQYDGAVPASKALARSLNIPMVRLLNEYGLEKFHRELKLLGLSTLNKPAKHYGLSLILGGAEARLWDLNIAYTHMAQQLSYKYVKPISLTRDEPHGRKPKTKNPSFKFDRGCIYSTLEAMVDVNRPDEDGNWRVFSSSQKIAWKTGTSFGFRDAWAIGITPDYVVSVWIGNADGEGRPGLTGIKAAAPLLFDVFAQLPRSQKWFAVPAEDMCRIPLCSESGHRASALCDKPENKLVPKTCMNTTACPYHQVVHLSMNGKNRVDSECEDVYHMKHVTWFLLPPLIEKYYKFNHPNYKELPDYKPGCLAKVSERSMALLYPKANSKIYVPIEIDGTIGRTIFEATHRHINKKIYWHLDDAYIGETKEIHQLALNPGIGKHKLMLVDEDGIAIQLTFEATGK